MKSTLKNMAILTMASCFCGLIGCADAIGTSNDNNTNNNQTPSTGTTQRPDGTEECTDCQEEIDFQQTGACPSWAYVACANDNKTRKYCGDDGYIKEETCPDICENGKCVQYANNSCAKPYEVTLGTPTTGSTNSKDTYAIQMDCSKSLKSNMGVFKIDIPEIGFYKFSLQSDSTADWGYILTPTCEISNEIDANCTIQGTSDEFTKLLSKGTYYLFAAPAQLFAKHFDASITVQPKSLKDSGICSGYQGNITLIDFSDGTYEDTHTTSKGTSMLPWDSNQGCTRLGSGGKEIAYLFSLTKKSTVNAELTINSKDNLPNTVALYMKRCDKTSLYPEQCSDNTPDNVISTSMKDLDVGEYLIFVDSDGKDFDYTLKMTRHDN